MAYDAALVFGGAIQPITPTASKDLNFEFSDIGQGKPLYLNVLCTTTLAATANSDVQFTLRTAAATGSLGAGTILGQSAIIDTVAAVPAGTVLWTFALPGAGKVLARVRLTWAKVDTNLPSAGNFLAVIDSQVQQGLGVRPPITPAT